MDAISGKVAFITGGAGGIGGAMARELTAAGAAVAIADLDFERAAAVAHDIGAANRTLGIRLDVTDPRSWSEARKATEAVLGPVDILCSNAGVSFAGPLDEIGIEAWRWVYEVNVIGALHALRTFLPSMKARRGEGHVILTCSITALRPYATQAAYTSSKAALLNMASVLSMELEATRIGVSAACPGIVATNLRANSLSARPAALQGGSTQAVASPLGAGMAPGAVARVMLEAIRANRFYVFTHADYKPALISETNLMLEGMARSADPDYRDAPILVAPLRH
jgi:NAD(P)-dependent dehydrogenase (short-subunit alcohol dehydrogenase family)